MADSFAHLHVHTEFSMLDGAAKLDDLVAKAVSDGQPALGMTDHGNMYGVLDFYKECRAQGVKPVIGTEAYLAYETRFERPNRRGKMDDSGGDTEGGRKLYYHLTLLAENNTGYRNLIQLSSLAFLEGYYYQPRMDWELLEKYHHGLIATTGCLGGHVLQALLKGDYADAKTKAARLQDIFGRDNLFVELQDHGLPEQTKTNPQLLRIAQEIGAPIIATNDSHYVHRHDSAAHDALLCVQTNSLISDPNRFRFNGNEHYLKTAAEMRHIFDEVPEACDNTLWIAERADVTIEFGNPQLPNFRVPEGFKDDASFLAHLIREGAQARWGKDVPAAILERLESETSVINHMGFASYFLIVWDLIRHAKQRGIRVGPGRGSAAGCAVAYCLAITEIDPIRYDLLFERFLNKSRVSMPDIDMDFDSRYRDEMIQYVTQKYGRDHVAQIITFGTIKARNAVRDAARVLGRPYAVGDKLAKAIPPLVMGRDTSLKHCLELNTKFEDGFRAAQELREFYASDVEMREVLDLAKGLEGLKRSTGIHAAAVVIAKQPITDYLPVQRKPETGKALEDCPVVTQFEMHGVEELGLLKMDFLGLRNLNILTDSMALIRAGGEPDFDIDAISLEDKKTFDLLGRGDTIGVFQLESPPMQQLLRAMKPTSLEDVSAVIALYRPGPMGVKMHIDFAERKNGRQPVEYFHPDAQEILGDTYGLMIYQESVMRVAQKFAGYSLADADNLRKACSKKVREMMAKERINFENGCETKGYGRVLGKELFDIIENFADYAFNKSHSFGYGYICYQTAFLKANYTLQYFTAMLSSVKDDLDKAAGYLTDARSSGIEVHAPNINVSGVDFTPMVEAKIINFGLSAIKGVGIAVCEKIVAERQDNGPFTSFHEFAMRVPSDCMNKKTIESLIKSGAFDSVGHTRKGLMEVFGKIIDDSLVRRAESDQGVMSLFDEMIADESTTFNVDIPIPLVEYEQSVKLKLEKEMLGLYISDHPLFGHEQTLRQHATATTADLESADNGAVIVLAGVITKSERKTTKRGEVMAIIQLEDLFGDAELTIFAKTLQQHGHKILDEAIVAIKCRVNRQDDRFSLATLEVIPIVLSTREPELRLDFPATTLDAETVKRLKEVLTEFPGPSFVYLHVGQSKVVRLGDEFRVDIDRVIPPLRLAFGSKVIR